MNTAIPEFVGRAAPDKKKIVTGGLAAIFVLIVWALWPSAKPPEFCPNSMYRPGQLVQDYDMRALRPVPSIVGKDCKPHAATADEITAAQARMQQWAKWDRTRSPELDEQSRSLGIVLTIIKPFLWFFGVVAALWLLLFAVFALFMLIGFLIVSVVGLRHMPMLVVLTPIIVWWKALIEFPASLSSRFIDVIHTREKVSGLQRIAMGYLKEFLGLGKFERPPLGDLGSARFGTLEELATLDRGKGAPLLLGSVAGMPLRFHTEKHVLIMAGTREGKGRDLIIPNLLRYQGSTLVLDVKGENYRSTAKHRAKLGPVRILDPWGMTDAATVGELMNFNPVRLIDPAHDDAVDNADVLAHGLIVPSGSETHWPNSARGLWRALLLHVASAPEFDGQRDLITARRLLMVNFMPVERDPNEDERAVQAREPSTLERMAENEAFDGVIAEFALSLIATPSKEAGSIISTAQRQTDFLDTPAMRAALRDIGERQIDFSEWRRGVMSCYVCIPAKMLEGNGQKWGRLVFGAALDEMLSETTPPPLPVQFILDEIAALDRLEQVERAVGLGAGYGLQLWTVWQDIAQLKGIYKARWASFFGNAGARYAFGLSEIESARYLSDMLGVTTETTTSQSADPLGLSITGQGRSVQTRPLMTPDEIMALPPDKMLVLFSGVRPIMAERVPWYEDASLKGLVS